ncbi:MAG: DUF4815 domain-containing protein [Verrucomicrobia bacterium]|nr:DUF4815 domain-containing protein [Verrucomicrobiota bacterium]
MKHLGLLFVLIASIVPTAFVSGSEITARDSAVLVPAGEYRVGARAVKVAQPATLAVAPAPVLTVADEPLKLSADKPVGWAKGTRLRALSARDVNACGSLVPASLELRRAKGGARLKVGDDYLADTAWGHVGIGTNSCVTIKDTVFASYRYSLLRMDTIQVSADGKASLKSGEPHISAPVPPAADAGCLAIAHVFVNYSDTAPNTAQIYPILETAAQAVTRTTPGRIPKTLAKLKAGGPVKIVCWGDSVTAGGNASKPEFRYPDVFAAGLRERFPQAKIEMQNTSAGGSHSRQWLFPDKFPYRGKPWQETGVTWQRIADAKPDLVTLEFVNDAGMTPAVVDEIYSDILKRVQGLGAELILITPHFTMWRMMGFKGMREAERRPYVLALREFADEHHIALADAAARWEHLWKEGLPYLTLLHNTINHPDDRGHRLFAEELWKCFR